MRHMFEGCHLRATSMNIVVLQFWSQVLVPKLVSHCVLFYRALPPRWCISFRHSCRSCYGPLSYLQWLLQLRCFRFIRWLWWYWTVWILTYLRLWYVFYLALLCGSWHTFPFTHSGEAPRLVIRAHRRPNSRYLYWLFMRPKLASAIIFQNAVPETVDSRI